MRGPKVDADVISADDTLLTITLPDTPRIGKRAGGRQLAVL
jgi:hypothetical protein